MQRDRSRSRGNAWNSRGTVQTKRGESFAINRASLREESGQTLILVALSLVVLCGFLGLAIDVGQLRAAEHHLQGVADAAAMAGALELSYCGSAECSEMTSAAQQAMTENGMTGSTLVQNCASAPTSGLVLTLNNGPCSLGATSDPNYGNSKYVEAIVTNDQPMYFAGVFGLNKARLSARAEATQGNSPFCIYIADSPGVGGTFSESNGGHLTANCDIDVGTSFTSTSGVHIDSKVLDADGTVTGSTQNINPSPVQNAPAMSDPLAGLQSPTAGGCGAALTVNSNQTISPGTYCSISVTKGTLTLNPGLYVMEGNFSTSNGTKVNGSGVTVYFSPSSKGTFLADSGSTITLTANTTDASAPDSSTSAYYGILLWEAAGDNTTFSFSPGSKNTWEGAIYLPSATIDIGDGGSINAKYTILVVNSLTMDSGGKLNITNDYSSLADGSPIKGVTAVLAE